MTPGNIPVLDLRGGPRERGRAHGEAVRARIDDTVRRWKAGLAESLKMDADDYIARLLGETRFIQAAQKWTPHLLDEVRGIAEGALQPFDTMFARQLADEQWWHTRDLQLGIETPVGEHCSALGVAHQAGSAPLIAQNLDVPRVYDGTQVVLRITYPEGFEALVYSWVGSLATNGVNNRGLAVCENTLMQLDHAIDGLPVDFVTRGIIESRTLAEAVDFIRRVRHASGQNYIIGSPEGIVDLECSANQVRDYTPYPGSTLVCHTNHPLINDDTGQFVAVLNRMPPDQRKVVEEAVNSKTRLASVKKRLDAVSSVTVDVIKEILRSHDSPDGPVCVHNDRGFTSGSMIMELCDSPAFHICFGPPCAGEYQKLRF